MDEKLKALIKQELVQAIAYFIERQHLVAQAMVEMGLNLEEVGKYKSAAWVSSKDADISKLDQICKDATDPQTLELVDVVKQAQVRQLSQKGTWGDKDENEWEYFLHGGGCSLINRHTKEVIDWDCPNVLAFDPYFFYRHLEWQVNVSGRQNQLGHMKQWIAQSSAQTSSIDALVDPLISELCDEGLIGEDWTLSDSEGSSQASSKVEILKRG